MGIEYHSLISQVSARLGLFRSQVLEPKVGRRPLTNFTDRSRRYSWQQSAIFWRPILFKVWTFKPIVYLVAQLYVDTILDVLASGKIVLQKDLVASNFFVLIQAKIRGRESPSLDGQPDDGAQRSGLRQHQGRQHQRGRGQKCCRRPESPGNDNPGMHYKMGHAWRHREKDELSEWNGLNFSECFIAFSSMGSSAWLSWLLLEWVYVEWFSETIWKNDSDSIVIKYEPEALRLVATY